MVQYFISEIQNRADGMNNVQPIVTRNSLSTGLSYAYDRCSKMVANTEFPTVTILLFDQDGNIILNQHLTTAYVPPVEGEGE